MEDHVLHITNLLCGYDAKQVLYIQELHIPKNKLCFIIGRSGVGKSTLLELIGLMNAPILNHGEYQLDYKFSNALLSHSNLVSTSKMTEVRSDYFSFLFQENNLLHHYSALENILLASVSSSTYNAALSDIHTLCEVLDLNQTLLERDIQNLSGGERKRVAFIRSLMKEHELIFGDEPTGNLDPHSSRLLMSALRKNIKQNNKTAVIVSHDIELALEYGDRVIVMTKKEGIGVINEQDVFNLENTNRNLLKDRILKLLVA